MIILLTILLLPTIYSLGEKSTATTDKGLKPGEQHELGLDQEQTIHNNIQTSIDTGSTLDLNQPLYKNNKDLVRKVLRDKYNIDVTNINNARISAGKLTVPGVVEIDMDTGRRITLDASSGRVNTLTDGQTTVVNAKGVKYNGVDLRVERGEKVVYEDSESINVQNFAGTTGQIIITDADLITTNGNTLKNIKSVQIRNVNNNLASLSFVCAGDDQSTVGAIQVNCQQNKRMQADFFDRGVSLTLQKGTRFSHKNLNGTADANDARFTLKSITPDTDEVTTVDTTTTFQNNTTKEVIIAKKETRFKLDENEGVYELHLGSQSRFSHQEENELSSFFTFNSQPAQHSLFVLKPSHFMPKEEALALFDGYANPSSQLFILKDIITFGVYDGLPYDLFQSLHVNNIATLDGSNLHLQNNEPCQEEKVFFSLHTGDFNVLEACNNLPVRYADFEQEGTPQRVQTFTTSYSDATLTFTNNIMQQTKNERLFSFYPDASIMMETIDNYERNFAQCSRIESFDQQTLLEVFS